MPHIVTITGNPNPQAKSNLLLSHAEKLISQAGLSYQRFSIHDFRPEELLYPNHTSTTAKALNTSIRLAYGVILASPVYQGSLSAGLKALLDHIEHRGLHGKSVLSLASSGSSAHRQSLELALIPILRSLQASQLLPGLNVTDREFALSPTGLSEDIQQRIQDSVESLLTTVEQNSAAAA